MSANAEQGQPGSTLDRSRYVLEVEDTFAGPLLDEHLWLPAYLPQWSSRSAAAARYRLGDAGLHLRIESDQAPWCPEFDGELRVSSLQTGVFSGALGSTVGQHRFRDGLVVREAQQAMALYTPRYGLFEARARALDDAATMVALWMIGYEDAPDRSAEICIFEIFGRDMAPESTRVGVGLHPFGDDTIEDDFERVVIPIDAREAHDYAAEWTPDYVAFYVDGVLVKSVAQSPRYPMQVMLDVFEFAGADWPPSPPDRSPRSSWSSTSVGSGQSTAPGLARPSPEPDRTVASAASRYTRHRTIRLAHPENAHAHVAL